jgi:hypothetical protein
MTVDRTDSFARFCLIEIMILEKSICSLYGKRSVFNKYSLVHQNEFAFVPFGVSEQYPTLLTKVKSKLAQAPNLLAIEPKDKREWNKSDTHKRQ